MTESLSAYIAPIKSRWVYHFIVSPKTSVIEKPEWYLSQNLKWIHQYIDDAEKKVKLTEAQEKKYKGFNVKQVFILSMIELAILRLDKDMKSISKSIDKTTSLSILVHTYNEVIQYAKVIRKLLGDRYLDLEDSHDILSVLSGECLFEKIVDIEWEYAEKMLRETVSSDTCWNLVLEGDFVDPYQIPRQVDCQYKLIELQCFLLNKFLSFLKKSVDSTPARMNILTDILFSNDQSTIDQNRVQRVQNGVNFLKLLLMEKFHIPAEVRDHLDPDLAGKSEKLIQEYKSFYFKLEDQSAKKQFESQLNKTRELKQSRKEV